MTRTIIAILCCLVCFLARAAEVAAPQGQSASAPAEPIDWVARQASVQPRNNEPIYLVVHSATDCPYCDTWREHRSGLRTAKQLHRNWPNVKFVFVERRTLRGDETAGLYPDDLRFLYDRRKASNTLRPGVPMFEVVFRDQVVYRKYGLEDWTERVLPKLAEFESRRRVEPQQEQDAAPKR